MSLVCWASAPGQEVAVRQNLPGRTSGPGTTRERAPVQYVEPKGTRSEERALCHGISYCWLCFVSEIQASPYSMRQQQERNRT
jgi:hypothetical protein